MNYPYPFTPELMAFYYVFIAIFGLCLGSFLNVCILRMPRGKSVILGRSRCPNCGHKIRWIENIPVLSWLFLLGKCASCKAAISFQYVVVEILTCVLVTVNWWRVVAFNQPISLFLFFTLATSLFIVTFFVDAKHKIIPNKLTYIVIIISLLLSALFPQSMGKTKFVDSLINSLLGLVVAGGSLALVALTGRLISGKEILGGGDIKFAAAVGACFGFYPPAWLFVTFLGSAMGSIAGLILLLPGKKKIFDALPFGPFLSIAGYVWILIGPEFLNYVSSHL